MNDPDIDPRDQSPPGAPGAADRRRPRWVYGVGQEPDARFTFANERTFLAWIRTSLGFLTAGLALGALAGYAPVARSDAHLAAIVLTLCGVLCAGLALLRWARNERALRLSRPLSSTLAMPLLTLALVAVAAITLEIVL